MALGAAHHSLNAGDQLILVERLGHIIVGAKAQRANLCLDNGVAGEDHHRRLHLGKPQALQNLEAAHVRQLQVEYDYVVVIQFTEIDTFFTEIGCVDVESFAPQHQFDTARHRAIVFDQQYTHSSGPLVARHPRRLGYRMGKH